MVFRTPPQISVEICFWLIIYHPYNILVDKVVSQHKNISATQDLLARCDRCISSDLVSYQSTFMQNHFRSETFQRPGTFFQSTHLDTEISPSGQCFHFNWYICWVTLK